MENSTLIDLLEQTVNQTTELKTIADNLQAQCEILDNHTDRLRYYAYERLVANLPISVFKFERGKAKVLDSKYEITLLFKRDTAKQFAYELLAWAEKQPKEEVK